MSLSPPPSVGMEYEDTDTESIDGIVPENDPQWDAEDAVWEEKAVGYYCYFRWSSGCSTKNKFKGIVTDHSSCIPPGEGKRVDFLTIKAFGSTEDRYKMKKDIREIFIFANKSSLFRPETDEEIRRSAIRKWTMREGWTDNKVVEVTPTRKKERGQSVSSITTAAPSPELDQPTINSVIVKKTKPSKPPAEPVEQRMAEDIVEEGYGVKIRTEIFGNCWSRQIPNFSFFN